MDQSKIIEALKKRLIYNEAVSLHRWRMQNEGERRVWEEMPAEEQEAKLWYAEYLLKKEMPEVF